MAVAVLCQVKLKEGANFEDKDAWMDKDVRPLEAWIKILPEKKWKHGHKQTHCGNDGKYSGGISHPSRLNWISYHGLGHGAKYISCYPRQLLLG